MALANIGSSTFTNLMARGGNNIPAFQSFFVYVSLNLVYTSLTLYKYGFKKWAKMVWRDGWRCTSHCLAFTELLLIAFSMADIILAFFDVQGNYFIVLAYKYTTLLSAELFGFWTVVCVVIISYVILKVRYHVTQYLGIFVACTGLGLLIASDYLRGANYPGEDRVKGDGFALLSSTLYAIDNVFEEFLVSKKPMYEVVGQLSFWGMLINGAQAAIFNRTQFRQATWNNAIGGYLAGYTVMLFIFYTLAPIMFRISSAVFFNISLLTMNFWGLIIGIQVFHYTVYWLYPIAFVLIVLGLFVYFLMEGILADAKKPWLGENQEAGVAGIGTGKRAQISGHAIV